VRAEALASLERLHEQMVAAASSDAWLDANHCFHLEIHRLAQMPHHAAIGRRVLTQIETYSRLLVDALQQRPEAEREHRAMVDALERGDAESLRATLEQHSIRARGVLVRHAADGSPSIERTASTSEAARSFAQRLHGRRAS
jgi:DNA-binding GntR family transcriptional regulator